MGTPEDRVRWNVGSPTPRGDEDDLPNDEDVPDTEPAPPSGDRPKPPPMVQHPPGPDANPIDPRTF